MTAADFAVAIGGALVGFALITRGIYKRKMWLYLLGLALLVQGFIDAVEYLSAAAIVAH